MMQNGDAQNVTEPDFRKKIFSGRKCRKYAGNHGFWTFLKILSLFFCDFLLKDAYLLYIGYNGIRFSWKIFLRSAQPEICRKSPFLGYPVSILVTIMKYFFVYRRVLIVPTQNRRQTSGNSLLCTRNCWKITGNGRKRRKNGFSSISRHWSNIFGWNLAHRCKMVIAK